ncbi:Cytochrome c [Polystyrenella longa]|uniref:Cytochrome c n=1 Tax=Polystyrenella longa TaxID=2528007 RepID=A0A518CKQ0_9PLAN|nr:PVC-type heme-binding CxxCH protein [Polystyrenella longa]QDU79801.1 Cytochrome c [Polystyrenella longa]
MFPRYMSIQMPLLVIIGLSYTSLLADEPETAGKLTPQEELATFTLPEEFEASVVVSEPDVSQPLSIEFDTKGRMWVLQYLQYPIPNGLKAVEVDQYLRTKYDKLPEPPPKGPQGEDRISIYQDQDGDGEMELITHFLSNLNLASGFALDHHGVYVVQPPYLLFYPDANQDDQPDGDPQVLLTGFGMDDAHAFANSLTWGPDGWLYGVQGSTVTANIRGIEFQQGCWRYHPETDRFELFSEGGGNSFGLDFDQYGNVFAGGNTVEPLVHHVQGAYYVKGFGKHGPLHNPHTYGYFQPVQHHGYVGDSLTGGFVLYQGGAFPEEFNNNCIAPNTRHSAMRWSTVEKRGSTFATRAVGDFITSTHNWFRPVESAVGPDGALYVADWYDYNIAHSSPQNHGKWYMPSRFDGRIFRVGPKTVTKFPALAGDLKQRNIDQLLELLEHPNAWFVRHARRLLVTQKEASLTTALSERALNTENEVLALQGLWILSQQGEMTEALALDLLNSPHEYVRAWTIRLHGDSGELYPAFFKACLNLAKSDPSPIVRSQLACTAKRLSSEQTLPLIFELWKQSEDLDDPFIPLLIWWALEDKAVSHSNEVVALFQQPSTWQQPLVQNVLLERIARRYTAEQSTAGYDALASLLALAPDELTRQSLVTGMTTALEGRRLDAIPPSLKPAIQQLLTSSLENPNIIQLGLRFGLAEAEPVAIQLLQGETLSDEERIALTTCLGQTGSNAVIVPLLEQLEASPNQPLRLATLEALGRFDDSTIGERLLDNLSSWEGRLKDQTITLLCSRQTWASLLLTGVESKQIDSADVTLDQVRQFLIHQDPEIQQQIKQIWGTIKPATPQEKQGRIKAVLKILSRSAGDPTKGKTVFVKTCGTCHKLHGEGTTIGPDLTGAERKDRRKLLENIIDPSAMIRSQYIMYTVVTDEGRILSGLLADSNDNTVTLIDKQNNRTIINRGNIDEMDESSLSLMPEKLLEPLSDQDLQDLFGYLQAN